MSEMIVSASNLIPQTIEEALVLIGKGYRPVAGGTDLMVRFHAVKTRGLPVDPIFYTGRIADFDKIKLEGGVLTAGASVTLAAITGFSGTPQILRDSLLSIASPGIRNIATLAGNICNASPAADSLPALYILDAVVHTAFKNAEGSGASVEDIPVAEFITGPGKTLASGKGLVTGISFEIPEHDGFIFRKVGTRAANALSKLNIAAIWNTAGNDPDFRLAAGACAPAVVRSEKAEKLVNGILPGAESEKINGVLEIYESLLNPIDDQRSSAKYRKNTALRLIESIIQNCGG